MRNFLTLLLLAMIVFSCDNTVEKKKPKSEKEVQTYTIGVNLPLTGNGSYFAEEFKKGLDMAFEFINQGGGKINIDVIYEDNKLNPKDAVSITKKFLEIDKVDLIIAGYTPIVRATAALVNQNEVPMLATLTSAEDVASSYEWVFRDFELESDIMPLLADYAYSGLDLKRGSSLVINDDMGNDAVRFFGEKFVEMGGVMIAGEVFEATDMDLRNKVSKVLDGKPEFIIVIGRGAAMINACRQIRERDENIAIISNNTVDSETFWEAMGNSGNHIWFPRLYPDYSSSRYIRANERFVEKYGQNINWLNLYGISIANYLARALRASEGDKMAIKEYLKTLNVQSIRGVLVMNEKGDVNIPHVIYERINGESVPVEINE